MKYLTHMLGQIKADIEINSTPEPRFSFADWKGVAMEIRFAKSVAGYYEGLRKVIDGGSESMDHEDALVTVQAWSALDAEYQEAYRRGVDRAAKQIWEWMQMGELHNLWIQD